jgi:hypothetical protein
MLMARGNEILEAAARRIAAEKDAQMITQICAWCGETVTGALGECRETFRAHVLKEHPEVALPNPNRRKRRMNAPRTLGKRTIEENTMLVRAQGGAGWYSAEAEA